MEDDYSFLKTELPDKTAELAAKEFGPFDELKLCIQGDMLADGSFGNVWMLMNDTKLGVISADEKGESPELLSLHPLEDIESVKVVPGISSGVVELVKDGIRKRLIRISNIRQKDFGDAVRLINGWIKDKEWKPEILDERRNICPMCKRPLPENMTVCPRCVNKGLMLRKILVFVKPFKGLLGLMFFFILLSTLFGLVTPYIGKVLIDDVLKPVKNMEWLPWLCAAMILSYSMQALTDGFMLRTSSKMGTSAIYNVRAVLFRKLQEQSLAFFSRHKTGGLITRVNQDTAQLQHLLVDFIPYGISGIIMMICTLLILFYLSWVLTLFVLGPVIGASAFVWFVFPKFRIYWERFFEKRSRLASFVENVVNGIRVVKAFAQETSEVDRFNTKSMEFRDAAYNAEKRWATTIPVLHFIIMIATPTVWLIGGMLLFRGSMTLGAIVAFIGYVGMLFRPVFILTRLAQLIPNALAAAGRVFDIIDSEPEIADVEDAVSMPDINGSIEFKDVEFGYDANKPVLQNISVDIKPHEMIGLVGHSGAGKSTTINLICRFFDVNSGEILIDGVDIRKIKYEDLRGQIGIVMQETFLLNGSIAENIAYGRPDATLPDIIKAAKAANAHDFIINKPDGYDTEITQGGGNLSAGEKQRISIARAILCDPKILILDEATASVDLETEKEIQDAIAVMVKERTTIAIAHRLSTLRAADRLVVLDKGKLAEIGTHEELADKKDGVYHKLVKLHQDTSGVRVVDG